MEIKYFWVTRDKELDTVYLWNKKPIRHIKKKENFWCSDFDEDNDIISQEHRLCKLDSEMFPKLTWDNDPLEVVLFPTDITHLMPVSGKEIEEKLKELPFPCSVCSHGHCMIPKGKEVCKHFDERVEYYKRLEL